MGFIFTIIEFIWCLLLKSHAYGKAHIIIQILGFVCDVIIAIFGNGALRAIPLIVDIAIQTIGCLVLNKYFPHAVDEIYEATINDEIIF